MRNLILLVLLTFPLFLTAQTKRPSYCDGPPPTSYAKGGDWGKGQKVVKRPSLPKFETEPVKQYKVQVAILRETSPEGYPFHESLIARHRPCEDVWVIESKDSFSTRAEAVAYQQKIEKLGYKGAYIIEMVGWDKK